MNITYKFFFVILNISLLLLFSANVFADDVGISDIVTYQTVTAGSDFDVNVLLTNNSSNSRNVDVNVEILSPIGAQAGNILESSVSISANTSQIVTFNFEWGTNFDTNYSVNSHIINAYLLNDFDGGSTNNNFYRKYFVIGKPNQKTPVPDFPIVFSLLLMFAFVLIFSKKDKIKIKK